MSRDGDMHTRKVSDEVPSTLFEERLSLPQYTNLNANLVPKTAVPRKRKLAPAKKVKARMNSSNNAGEERVSFPQSSSPKGQANPAISGRFRVTKKVTHDGGTHTKDDLKNVSGAQVTTTATSTSGDRVISRASHEKLQAFRLQHDPANLRSCDTTAAFGLACTESIVEQSHEVNSFPSIRTMQDDSDNNSKAEMTRLLTEVVGTPSSKDSFLLATDQVLMLPTPIQTPPNLALLPSETRAPSMNRMMQSPSCDSSRGRVMQEYSHHSSSACDHPRRSNRDAAFKTISRDFSLADDDKTNSPVKRAQDHARRGAMSRLKETEDSNDDQLLDERKHIKHTTVDDVLGPDGQTSFRATPSIGKGCWNTSSIDVDDEELADNDLLEFLSNMDEFSEPFQRSTNDFSAPSEVGDGINTIYQVSSPRANRFQSPHADRTDSFAIFDDDDDDLEVELIKLTETVVFSNTGVVPSSGTCNGSEPLEPGVNLNISKEGTSTLCSDDITSRSNQPKPIVRPPFPKLIKDRSPIMGLSASSVLRTCFRVAEALNAGCAAVRNKQHILLELYARVLSSYREPDGVKQYFVFADLFHDHPPLLNGVYEIWKGVALWEYHSSRFLEDHGRGRMCRCIGKMKREGKEWKLLILNIWEASWDDVLHVKDIVCS